MTTLEDVLVLNQAAKALAKEGHDFSGTSSTVERIDALATACEHLATVCEWLLKEMEKRPCP